MYKDTQYINNNTTGDINLPAIPVPALSVVKVSHWDDLAGSEGSCSWWGYLITE